MKIEEFNKTFALFMIIAVVSFLGFCTENLWRIATKGVIDNRNMHLPFLIGYGLAIMLIYFLFGTPQAPKFFGYDLAIESKAVSTLFYIVTVFLCVSVGEWALGTAVEKLTGIVWWDYSSLPLHITKYTSVFTSIGFSLMITVFMGCFFTRLYNWFLSLNPTLLGIISCILMILMTGDFIISAVKMYKTGKLLELWKIVLADR